MLWARCKAALSPECRTVDKQPQGNLPEVASFLFIVASPGESAFVARVNAIGRVRAVIDKGREVHVEALRDPLAYAGDGPHGDLSETASELGGSCCLRYDRAPEPSPPQLRPFVVLTMGRPSQTGSETRQDENQARALP